MLMNKIDVELAKNSKNIKTAELAKFCTRQKRVFLYGAGDVCRGIIRLLKQMGISPEGIIVSDGHKKCDSVEGIRVFELSNSRLQEEDGIIISTAPYTDGIVTALKEKGVIDNKIYVQNIYDNYLFDRKAVNKKSIQGGFFSKYEELDKLGMKFGTDKSSVSLNYLNKYDFFLHRFKDEKITLIELGVKYGASIRMWREYFSKAEIIGVDVNKDCKAYEDCDANTEIIIGDLSDSKTMGELVKLHPTIIVDDASHRWSHQIKALCYLFPKLAGGGVYILEDIVTSFSMWNGGGFDDIAFSAYDFCECIAMAVSSGEPLRCSDIKIEVMRTLIPEIEELARDIEMLSFIHGSCILIKR